MTWLIALLTVVTVVIWSTAVAALDHDNLDPNRPLQMEDAYAIPTGELGVESGVRLEKRRGASTAVVFQPQILYGAFPNTQLEIQSDLFSTASSVVGPNRTGALHLGALYNFNTETLHWPALAIRVGLDLPTGPHTRGVDTQLTGIMTRSVGRLRAHLNVGYTAMSDPRPTERRGIYGVVAALSYPIGYPRRFRETLVVDVYSRQSHVLGQANYTGVEVGVRHQLSSRVVLDAGIGSELAGPADRSTVMVTAGVSVGF